MIKKEMQYNKETVTLENEKIIVRLIPELGNKVSSIYSKERDFEFLFQPTKGEFTDVEYGADFSTGSRCGLDDCIPSIDPCDYKDTGIKMVDHGDTWSIPWNVIVEDNKVIGKVNLKTLPLEFQRTVSLNGNEVLIEYQVKNLSDETHQYLWAFHGLNNFNDKTYLEFPKELNNYINVQNDEKWDDIRNLGNFKKNWTFKYYFTDKIENGWATLVYPDKKLKYTIKFNPEENPYLGVWITTGGYMDEVNIGVEPCNGFYDSLERAINNDKVKSIKANEIDTWNIRILIEEI